MKNEYIVKYKHREDESTRSTLVIAREIAPNGDGSVMFMGDNKEITGVFFGVVNVLRIVDISDNDDEKSVDSPSSVDVSSPPSTESGVLIPPGYTGYGKYVDDSAKSGDPQ